MKEALEQFMSSCWQRHETETEQVSSELAQTPLNKIESDPRAFSNLVIHVFGAHLSDWQAGIDILEKIDNSDAAEGIDVLKYCAEKSESTNPTVLAKAAGILATIGAVTRAGLAFQKAIASENIVDSRALAVAGNNLASELSAKDELSNLEIDLMISAAKAAHHYWGIAGGWLEVERAKYVLASCLLKAGDLEQSQIHAEQCLNLCKANNADEFELFFAHQMIAKINKAWCQNLKEKVSDDLKGYCEMPS